MKALIICTSVSWGGLEQVALRDAIELRKKGLDIEVMGPGEGPFFEKAKKSGFVYHTVKSQKKYLNLELVFKLRKAIKKSRIDLIHMHTFNTIFPVLLAVRGLSVKAFATRHIYVEHVKKDFFHRWYLNRLNKLFAISDFARQNLLDTYPLPPEKIQTLYIGINLNRFKCTKEKQEEFRKEFVAIPKDKRIVGVVGRIDPMKGQLEFIEAIPQILKYCPNTHFLVIGKTTSEKEDYYLKLIQQSAKSLGVEKAITFAGFYEDVSAPLSIMDVLVMPSYFEAFGLTALQAMACEVPTVITAKGSADEIIPSEECGIKIPSKDSHAIAEAVVKLLSSESLRTNIKQNALRRVQLLFDEKKYFVDLIKTYRKMNIKGIVFDLDGTLIDSSKAIIDSLFAAVDYYKIKPSITKNDSCLFMGKSLKETLKIIIPNVDNDTMHKIGKYYVAHYHEYQIKDARLFPKVRETIKALNEKKIKLAVATAKHSDCAEAELAATGVAKYFTVIRGTDDGVPSKPDPTLLLQICKNFRLEPKDVLMVGDTDRDVIFGKNAACNTCCVTHGNWPKERFIRENIIPDFFLDEFDDLLAML